MFEEGLVPAQDRMIRVFHEQGARYVIRCLSNERRNVYVVAEVLW
jgi:hypothetical protein